MKLSNRNIFALLAASASLLTSCSDDVLFRDEQKEGDGFHGVVLLLPEIPEDATPVTGTRGDGQLIGYTRAEASVSNRRVFLYPLKDDGTVDENPYQYTDEEFKAIGTPSNGYAAYQLNVPTGSYKMYVTANISGLNKTTTRTELMNFKVSAPADDDNGIPMSCSNEELEVDRGNTGTSTTVGNGFVTINPGEADLTIKANMKYCVAKVRVTTLNDIRPSELVNSISVTGQLTSSSMFPGKYGMEKNGVFEAIRDTKDKENAFKATDAQSITGTYYKEAKINATAVENSNVETSNLGADFTPAAGNTQAYTHQTIFYVPERLFQTGDDVTKVTVSIGGNEAVIPVGAPDVTGGTQKIIERSHFYDYVLTPDGKFYLQVQRWQPDIIAGSLNGNSWLEVDKTAISVSAGMETHLAYKGGAGVTAHCNTYLDANGEYQDIYDFDYDNVHGILTITLNKDIDRDEFTALKDTDDWKYITLSCGTIVKKIEVANLDYTEYILDDTMVTIDVNERKQSGRYSNFIPVSLNSNVKYIKFEKVDWPASADEGDPKSLILQDSNGATIPVGTKLEVPEDGKIDFQIAFNDLNSDRKLWQDSHDMQVVVYALDKDGNTITSDGQIVKCTVGVYVRPSYDTYRIHFKGDGWNHPHIFVYQCLQLPGDLIANTGAKPNQPVGHNKDYAALEYDFTGAVAFKGWYVDAYNNPTAPGGTDNYFWIFNDGTSWDPNNPTDFSRHYYRMDFAKDHRDKLRTGKNGGSYCTDCTKADFGMNWPGIHMLPEGNGWWFFELSGVADPGKALVMFTDCSENSHGYGDWMEGKRYPKKEQPGVALFDYPTKEGWFLYKNSGTLAFQSENPETSQGGGGNTHPQTTSTFEVGTTYAILFNTSATVWAWTVTSTGVTAEEISKTKGQNWPGSNYNRIYTFTPTKADGTTIKVKYNSVENNEHATHVSAFKWNATTNRYEATINP